MDKLHEKIRRAQINAGEQAVVKHLEELGLEKKTPSKEAIFKELLHTALVLNDKLQHHVDHVEYVGSMSLAERFREIVNEAWHFSCGWTK